VQYNKLIEVTRARVEHDHPRGRKDRLLREAIFAIFPYPRRLRALRLPLRLYQRSPLPRLMRRSGLLERMSPTLAAMERLAPPAGRAVQLPERLPPQGTRRARVAMLTGCVQGEFFPQVNAATARVLAAEGCEVMIPRAQACCGALSLHTGRDDEAREFARATMAAFESADVVVVNSAGCGSAMKDYAALFAGDPEWADRAAALTGKTRDLAEFLVELGPRAARLPLPVTVAYHDACHLGHAQGIRAQPRALLAGIPELEVREVPEPEICCGCSSPRRPRSWANARPPECGRRARRCWSPPTRDAPSRSPPRCAAWRPPETVPRPAGPPAGPAAVASEWPIRPRSSMPPCAASVAPRFSADAAAW
jgi:glycolate oxidase iron-sulfur subunit